MIVYSTGYNRMKCILYVHIFRYHYIYFKLHLTLNCLVLLFCKMIYMSLLLYRGRNQTSTWETHLILGWVWTLKCYSVQCLKWTLDAGQMCCWCELETSVRRRHVLTSSVLNCASFFCMMTIHLSLSAERFPRNRERRLYRTILLPKTIKCMQF